MKALSVRQPWAWAIIYALKNIENRGWPINYRGDILIHAAKTCTKKEYQLSIEFCQGIGVIIPELISLRRGQIIGIVTIVDCKFSQVASGWGMPGQYHWKLENPREITPIPYIGRLGIFEVPDELVRSAIARVKSVLSLFSGIGGLCHHGISAAGLSHKFRVQQFVEISPYSQSQLRHEQPGIPIHADITNYHCDRRQFDIICGGFPCQGTSNSGNRLGLADFRSALWGEQFRIINQCRPAIALIENPTGLLSRGMATVLEDLSEIR